MDDSACRAVGRVANQGDVGMIVMTPPITQWLVSIFNAVNSLWSKEGLGQRSIIGIVGMGEYQGYRAVKGEARLGVVAEVAHRQSQSQRDGLQCRVQRLEVVAGLGHLPVVLLHQAGEHQDDFAAGAFVMRPEFRVGRRDDAQLNGPADVPHFHGIFGGQGSDVGIAREGVAVAAQVGLEIEGLEQDFQHVHARNRRVRLKGQAVAVEGRHAVAILQVEQRAGGTVIVG